MCGEQNGRRKKMTITWYVGDLNISHIHSDVVYGVVSMVEFHYGKMNVI